MHKSFSDNLVLDRATARSIDSITIEKFGLPGVILMENAGRNSAEYLLSLRNAIDARDRDPVAICCGKGNNGGDGYVMARYLDNYGIPVKVLLFVDKSKIAQDALTHFRVMQNAGIEVIELYQDNKFDIQTMRRELGDVKWIIDGLFGTGLKGELKGPYAEIIFEINSFAASSADSKIFAIDIPSGLDCDSGEPIARITRLDNTLIDNNRVQNINFDFVADNFAIRADYTATFIGMKKGFLNAAAEKWLGQVKVIDIGIPKKALETLT